MRCMYLLVASALLAATVNLHGCQVSEQTLRRLSEKETIITQMEEKNALVPAASKEAHIEEKLRKIEARKKDLEVSLRENRREIYKLHEQLKAFEKHGNMRRLAGDFANIEEKLREIKALKEDLEASQRENQKEIYKLHEHLKAFEKHGGNMRRLAGDFANIEEQLHEMKARQKDLEASRDTQMEIYKLQEQSKAFEAHGGNMRPLAGDFANIEEKSREIDALKKKLEAHQAENYKHREQLKASEKQEKAFEKQHEGAKVLEGEKLEIHERMKALEKIGGKMRRRAGEHANIEEKSSEKSH